MNHCKDCKKLSLAAGQAFTRYICPHCLKEQMHSNTATPRLCRECSISLNRCQRCIKEIKWDFQ